MEEPARLVCPQCDLVYRLKKITPGRVHVCKNCGTPLRNPDAAAGAGARASVRAASAAGAAGSAGSASDLPRLPKLIEQLTARLDAMQAAADAAASAAADAENSDAAESSESPAAQLLAAVARLEEEVARSDEKLGAAVGEKITGALDDRLGGKFDEKLQFLADDITGRLSALNETLNTTLNEKLAAAQPASSAGAEDFLALRSALETARVELSGRIDDFRSAQRKEISALLAPYAEAGKTTVEVDIDELADRLVAGVRGRGPLYDTETGSAVDALARLADQLVREQNANTARLDKLASEIHSAIANIAKLEEWQTELPDRVADEIGATVEARVVGPISGALARQAPSILSDLQDSKLVDIVSRSVREAQRPLLREILAGGRNGVPVWLFASVLLPLLLILGYLFLPGEMGGYGGGAAAAAIPAEVTDALVRIETAGVPLTAAAEDRLLGIEEAVLDIHDQALAHVKNAATLEEEVKNLRRLLEERDGIIAEYTTTLERQTKRLQAYEFRLVQLGVKPDAVAGQ